MKERRDKRARGKHHEADKESNLIAKETTHCHKLLIKKHKNPFVVDLITLETSTEQLISLMDKAIHLQPLETLGGSIESLKSYYQMIRNFATMAGSYQHLIPGQCNISSILKLSDFLLDLDLEKFKRLSSNLPRMLDAEIPPTWTTLVDREAPGSSSWESIICRIDKMLPPEIDLTDSSQDQKFEESAALLMDEFSEISALQEMDKWLTSRPEVYKNPIHLTSKLALSRMIVRKMTRPVHISLVIAMLNEQNRIFPKSWDNPNGEDFVRRKARQMAWLFSGTLISYDILYVDDGCPNRSGAKAEQIIASEGLANAKVLYLKDAIKGQLPVSCGLHTTDDSCKGGSIQYGMWQSLQNHASRDDTHVIVYTDADMSAPVHQLGLLLAGLDDKTRVVIGSRYDARSVCRGPWGKNSQVQGMHEFDRRMIRLRSLLFYRLFPQLGTITDTQCGFKAFGADLLNKILLKTTIRTFSFDTEVLVLSTAENSSIAVAPIYWHDSLAESNFYA